MARKTKCNRICNEFLLEQIHDQNKRLIYSFEEYLISVDKSPMTIEQYRNDLQIFFCWNVTDNNNKPFTSITKKDYAKFQYKALMYWEWSSNRLRRVKATISSLSNYIENMLDEEDEFKGFRSSIRKIESPALVPVREKSIFTKEELQSLLDLLVEEKFYKQACALSLAMNSARRKSELPRFKVSYFTDENVLFGSLYKTPERVKTKGRTSRGKMIYLYVLKKEFDPYLALWLKEREEKGIDSEWLFPKQANPQEHITRDTMDGWSEMFTKRLGKDFYWHSMRHFMVTELLKYNLPPHVIKDIVGWDSTEMVDLYNDLTIDDTLGQYFDENGLKTMQTGGVIL